MAIYFAYAKCGAMVRGWAAGGPAAVLGVASSANDGDLGRIYEPQRHRSQLGPRADRGPLWPRRAAYDERAPGGAGGDHRGAAGVQALERGVRAGARRPD